MKVDLQSDIRYFVPFKEHLLHDYSNLEIFLVIVNVILFSASYNQDVDSEISTVLIYIMFAIAYFILTSTCLSGAVLIKRFFTFFEDKKSSNVLSEAGTAKISVKTNCSTIPKKPIAKKPNGSILRTEEKKLSQNNFY